jgi:hypothetical protein
MLERVGSHNGAIGVATLGDLVGLKRHLMLVDRIAVMHPTDPRSDWECRAHDPALASDLDWLQGKGVLLRVDGTSDVETGIEKIEAVDGRCVLKMSNRAGLIRVVRRSKPGGTGPRAAVTVGRFKDALMETLCRLECEALRRSADVDVFSLHAPGKYLRWPPSHQVDTGDVVRIVVKALPFPDEATSLEHILEFRENELSAGTPLALRRWISKVARAQSTELEIAQELEWLLSEYEQHMRLHELKIRKGVLETIVAFTAEAAENIAKLRLGKLARSLFTISNRRIELLEGELKAPGREIAYISRARQAFAPR